MNLDVLMSPYVESARHRADTLDGLEPRHRADVLPVVGQDPRAHAVAPRHRAEVYAA